MTPRTCTGSKHGRRRPTAISNAEYIFEVRGKEIRIPTTTKSLSHQDIPKVSVPRLTGWRDLLRWGLQENVPGAFPFTAGIYPFKRQGEDPTRMFAGEGGPERTNRRFHYVSGDCPPSACPPPSTRSPSTARTPTRARTSTARSATRA